MKIIIDTVALTDFLANMNKARNPDQKHEALSAFLNTFAGDNANKNVTNPTFLEHTKYSGNCVSCKKHFLVGDPIWFHTVNGQYRRYCGLNVKCFPKDFADRMQMNGNYSSYIDGLYK